MEQIQLVIYDIISRTGEIIEDGTTVATYIPALPCAAHYEEDT